MNKYYYLFALESYDNLINGFHRLVNKFSTSIEALDYYKQHLEYKTDIKYQEDKILIDIVKCYIWNAQTGQLDLYFRNELKHCFAVGNLYTHNKQKTTPLICQESRKIRPGSQKRYWFYFMTSEGYHVSTDGVIISTNIIEEHDTAFKIRLMNRFQDKYQLDDYTKLLGFYYYDSHTHQTHLYISKQDIYQYTSNNHYICILDFETNCNENNNKNMNEIIEFSSVLYKWNLINNNFIQVNKYQDYIKPVHTGNLTQYCINLTGIIQQQVDNGILFRDAFQRHYDWLKTYVPPVLLLNSTTIVTCGKWDLQVMLVKDCKRNGIYYYPDVYKKFIDIKLSFKEIFKTSEVYGLNTMLNIINIKLQPHDGIDYCNNVGQLFHYLIKKGYQLGNKDIIYVKPYQTKKRECYQNTIK